MLAGSARTAPALPKLPDPRAAVPRPELRTLDNGLEVCVLPWRRAPVVATAFVYRAGTLDESPEHGGTAHFLEHMMFKGTARRGPGELDRVTRALGGSNNAFTSHDLTLYYFTFAADRWPTALELERDRMDGLLLDPVDVDSEREVILEELAMYEGEPWDALDQASSARFFARPVTSQTSPIPTGGRCWAPGRRWRRSTEASSRDSTVGISCRRTRC